MSTLAQIRDALKADLAIQSSEGISDSDIEGYISAALTQHDKYASISTLSAQEEECVKLLASSKICLRRAALSVNDANASGGAGFGQDRNSPYYKNMNMASFFQKRYADALRDMGIETNAGGITMGQLVRYDEELSAAVPFQVSPEPPAVTLSLVSKGSGEAIIKWVVQADNFANFWDFQIFFIEGSTAIIEEWNFASTTGIPKINDTAKKLLTVNDWNTRQVKVKDLDLAVTNRFVVVLRSRSDKYSYSNELVVTP